MRYNEDMGRRINGDGNLYFDRSRNRWRGRYRVLSPYGRHVYKYVSAQTKKAASKELEASIAEYERNGGLVDSSISLADYLELWLSTVVREQLAPGTAAGYEGHVRNHLIPLLGNVSLVSLNLFTIQKAFNELKLRGMHPTTMRRVKATLSSALNYAVRAGFLPTQVNPASFVAIPGQRRAQTEVLDPHQLRLLLHVTADDMPFGMLFRLAAITGLRAGELAGLTWSDIDFERGLLRVERTIQRVKKTWVVAPTKNASSQASVVIDPGTLALLKAYREQQQFYVLATTEWTKLGVLFLSRHGTPLHQSTVLAKLRSYCEPLGLPAIRVHDLRHGLATMLLEAGENPKVVSEALRHSSVSTTMNTYAHVTKGRKRTAIEAIALELDSADLEVSA